MSTELKSEDILIQVRSQLNKDQIKLWQEPYLDQTSGTSLKDIEELAVKYVPILNLTVQEVMTALAELQSHAVNRVKANNEFKETGVALLRLKVPPRPDGSKILNLNIKLSALGNELIEATANALAVNASRVKLIHLGRVVKKDVNLSTQAIKNGAQILAAVLADSPSKLRRDGDLYQEMQLARKDAELLSDSADSDFGHYIQLEDQSGNILDIPESERKALMVGVALHERGKSATKKKNYSLALVLLLEAENHFSECNASILKTVDNYALLNLDISWCYLCLQSITHIPDAESRLKVCEKNFNTTYGANLERLIALKGSSGTEQALLMRLHLLQAIVFYHQNRRNEARLLLEQVETELAELVVEEPSVQCLMGQGCTEREARVSLRACRGDIEAAMEKVNSTREQRIEARRRALEEYDSRKLGKCIDGKQNISMTFVRMLVDMGYPRHTAILALKNSNNHVSNAVQIILEQPDLLQQQDSLPNSSSDLSLSVDDDALDQLVAIGYEPHMARAALLEAGNHLQDAAEKLLAAGGILPSGFAEMVENAVASSSLAGGSDSPILTKEEREMKIKKNLEVKAAFERFAEEIEPDDDDYIDHAMTQEIEFLHQYKQLLQ